ncbi:hypothetical protein [Novosphingobium jiangmenense]|uniref:Uncharacterized protein n=1 Tax=Novosphingobium jiangmenense TaxID=2791981 RepID=A0ABS0HF59_9SPHN|nr:hypothetical protein [Novosphingobium jiangmenense]MBF9150901.1 hypothetical protein [Novosphingobium jiangmenense]
MSVVGNGISPEGAPTFTFGKVVQFLAVAFDVSGIKYKTFASRLQQLQKMGLPNGTNTGRGIRAAYETWHLCEFQFYLDLLQAGVSPSMVAARFADAPFYAAEGVGSEAESRAAEGEHFYAYVQINALKYLESDSLSALRDDSSSYTEFSLGSDLSRLLPIARHKPGVLVDLAVRIDVLKRAVGKVMPQHADLAFFRKPGGE